ncbi:hypothetical protein [Lysinibacillus sphaericus]|uniref:Uncharacterized protein n=1 Tax=Lysinibacillus sphaericus TaxID=1421 RepID=A0AAJ4ZTJ7_LYSSH|nr:hypothetical protein [Lysinibacillus sphaericus]MED4543274.1 hypothetical protein [Lysinibacillus sphaericus]GEC84568.1 hypothetical protein LSP03_43110 [Lysinibacillus sphaericus]SUV16288.1 Uncharacterised protein [Lysinibacillus sphaericus]
MLLKFAISDVLSKKELQNLSRNTLKGYAISTHMEEYRKKVPANHSDFLQVNLV